jgi:hypothetical protein
MVHVGTGVGSSVTITRNILVPGWIMVFGLVSLSNPPGGVWASLSMCVVGLVVIPGLLLIGSASGPRQSPPA